MKRRSGASSSAVLMGTSAVFVVLAILRFVRQLSDAKRAGDAAQYQEILTVAVVTAAAVVVIAVGLVLAMVPAARRNRRLARLYPGAAVYSARWTKSVGQSLISLGALTEDDVRKLFALSITVLANQQGVGIWLGVGEPRRIFQLPWEEVENVSVVDAYNGPSRMNALRLSITDPRNMDLDLPLSSDRWMGLIPANRASAESIAAVLRGISQRDAPMM